MHIQNSSYVSNYTKVRAANKAEIVNKATEEELFRWCFVPSQPQKIISGLSRRRKKEEKEKLVSTWMLRPINRTKVTQDEEKIEEEEEKKEEEDDRARRSL